MNPFQLGITGGIGSGKSIVCRILNVLGIPVYNADEASKKLLNSNSSIIKTVTELFGPQAYLPQGGADTKYIAGIVFNDEKKLAALNDILHPAVQINYLEWLNTKAGAVIVAKEAAILFESGSYKGLDAVVAVIAPEELRIRRATARDGKSEKQVRKIIEAQLPDSDLQIRSNFVIINDENQLVVPQVLNIIEKIKKTAF